MDMKARMAIGVARACHCHDAEGITTPSQTITSTSMKTQGKPPVAAAVAPSQTSPAAAEMKCGGYEWAK